jgi:hypothetical protein
MLILPPGHHREITERRRIVGRERWMVGGVGALVVLLAVAVLIGIAGGGSKPRRGCLDVSFASTLGVQQIVQCGKAAGATCASLGIPGGYAGTAERLIAADCRRLKLPVG